MRAIDQPVDVLAGAAEFHQIPGRLLEVIGEDLLDLPDPLPGDVLQPVREPSVEVGARRLRRLPIGRLLDQRMVETERVLADERRSIRRDQLTTDEVLQDRAHPRTEVLGHEIEDRPPPEHVSDHGGRADDGALLGGQPVQASSEQGMDRGRNRDRKSAGGRAVERSVVAKHLEDLLHEQGIASPHVGDLIVQTRIETFPVQDLLDQVGGLPLAERLQLQGRSWTAPA